MTADVWGGRSDSTGVLCAIGVAPCSIRGAADVRADRASGAAVQAVGNRLPVSASMC